MYTSDLRKLRRNQVGKPYPWEASKEFEMVPSKHKMRRVDNHVIKLDKLGERMGIIKA